MYRFRTINSLLDGHHELENQEIYFAAPEELNDPMEGYQDVFWKGDSIIWRNFIVNYIKSLEHAFGLAFLLRDKEKIEDKDILVLSQPHGLNGLDNQKLIQQIVAKTFSYEFINSFPKNLSERTNAIRRDELLSYLDFIHLFALNSISEVYLEKRFITKPFFKCNLRTFSNLLKQPESLVDLVNKLETEINNSDRFFSISNMYSQQVKLLKMYNLSEKEVKSNSFFLISEFPEKYLSKLESSIYPDWFTASFLSECDNSAVWGHYGDNHRGVCLKFKVNEQEGKLNMNLVTEHGYSSGPIIGLIPHTFKEIQYCNKHVEIDFFRSIARMNKMTLKILWYSDGKGNLSVCGEHLNGIETEDDWRNKYWDNFDKSLVVKLKEWEYEKEYRLVISGDFIDYIEKEKRKLKYDFNDLESIIFGIKTNAKDKLKIIKIIENKCKKNNRKEFDFQQAYYSKDEGVIKTYKLNLLKFD